MSEQDEKKDDDLDIAAIAAQFKEGDPAPKVDLVDVNVIETESESEAEAEAEADLEEEAPPEPAPVQAPVKKVVKRAPTPVVEEAEEHEMTTDSNEAAAQSSILPKDIRDHLDALSSVVLDSADVASNAATSATGLAGELQNSVKSVQAAIDAASKQGKIVLIGAGGILMVSVAVFVAMSATLQSRINQTDAMLLAVGKRVVELNAGIEGIDAMNRSLSSFSERTDAIMAAQAKLEEQIKVSLGESKDLVNSLPAQTAKSVEGISKNIAAQVVAMDAQMKKQASAMASLGGQVKSLAGSVGDVAPLKRDVQALVTLQRQRYLEALQQQRAGTGSAAEVIVQFPNPKAVKTPEKATQ